ncbi:MAG: OmpA family protein [Deltaproteobacteria bacterium]|nr:OmpA family protein [Deltaproteobacteria bacterium]MCW5804074.1 OmpA family protein [Deltaproteobacteria bacterium]
MRSSLSLLLFVVASGCATPNTGKVCSPVSSWAAPAYECVAMIQPVAAPEPAPTPEPTPEPPPPPPPKEEKIELRGRVEFDTNSDVILPAGKPILDEVAKVMKDHPEILKVEVQGHTDTDGTHDYNVKLSDRRAASVRRYLESKGIASDRMVSKGYGPDKPIASNDNDAGKADNRRVEVIILQKK